MAGSLLLRAPLVSNPPPSLTPLPQPCTSLSDMFSITLLSAVIARHHDKGGGDSTSVWWFVGCVVCVVKDMHLVNDACF
jgi:hypothetical protein